MGNSTKKSASKVDAAPAVAAPTKPMKKVGEPSELAPAVFPCLSSWGEEEISEREKQERELCGYGSGEVVCKERDVGMGPLGYGTQADSNPLIIRLFGDEYCPQLGQDLHQDGEDHPYGGIITAEN